MTTEGHEEPVLRITQITDTHLYADPEGRLLGLDTRHCLEQVVDHARTRQADLIVASGDLTHDGSEQAYELVRQCFSVLNTPVHCLPGNHDEATMLKNCMAGDGCYSHSSLHINGWSQVFLDSTVAGSEGGHLSDDELQHLDTALHEAGETPTLVWLHHQPVKIGSRWLDTMAIENAEAFFNVVDKHPQVRGIVWGHVHQIYEQERNGVQLLATPSTCIQFMPGSDEFAIEHTPPGYRWLELYNDGTLKTGVVRLAEIPGTIDLNARGY